MTCEIVVMNRRAVALAADSAVTITRWIEGVEERRYFKGVRKVFQISNHHPVGIMVYGSGDLQQAPWELITNEYRKQLGEKSFDHLEQYGADLFAFIENSKELFPTDYQDSLFIEDCTKAAILFFHTIVAHDTSYLQASDDSARSIAAKSFIGASLNNLKKEPPPNGFSETDIDDARAIFTQRLKSRLGDFDFPKESPIDELIEFAIEAIFRRQLYMAETGVVIAGFGDKNYYPGYREYSCFGHVLGKIAVRERSSHDITYQSASHIKGFATTHMVETFLFGISPDAYTCASSLCEDALKNFGGSITSNTQLTGSTTLSSILSEFKVSLLEQCGKAHYDPLTRVVASLPIDDMAELAETLVTLESLKEKVTRPTESVGGPVDVAMITRSEGLIWVKRKHYFNTELNPRYLHKLSRL